MATAHAEPNYMAIFWWLFALTVAEIAVIYMGLPRLVLGILLVGLAAFLPGRVLFPAPVLQPRLDSVSGDRGSGARRRSLASRTEARAGVDGADREDVALPGSKSSTGACPSSKSRRAASRHPGHHRPGVLDHTRLEGIHECRAVAGCGGHHKGLVNEESLVAVGQLVLEDAREQRHTRERVADLVCKRGRELARRETIPPSDVLELAEIAAREEAALRSLVLRHQGTELSGKASLRAALEALARTVPELPITVSAVGAIQMPSSTVDEVLAAVRQAVENVVRHATATQAFVFAEEDDGMVVVTVRDDGRGFSYDEEVLRARGRCGILRSIKGRIEDLGGAVRVHTAPGRGTEVELLVPVVRQ